MDKVVKQYWLWKQSQKLNRTMRPLKVIEERKYLTKDGIKNHNNLTLKDKFQLNIVIN